MASLLVPSKLLTSSSNVGVLFTQNDGTTLGDVRRFFRLPEAMVRERENTQDAPRSNPDFRLDVNKRYEIVMPSQSRAWSSRDVCANAAKLLVSATNIPPLIFNNPIDFFRDSLYVLIVLLQTTLRLLVVGWIFVVGLISTGLMVPIQGLYWLFSRSLATVAVHCAAGLPSITVDPLSQVFTSISCFIAVTGSFVLLHFLAISLVNQLLLLLLEWLNHILSAVVNFLAACFGNNSLSAKQRVVFLFIFISLPLLNSVPFLGGLFAFRATILLWAFLMLLNRLQMLKMPRGAPATWRQLARTQRAVLIQHCVLWSMPAVSFISLQYFTEMTTLLLAWFLIAMSRLTPIVAQ